MKLKTYLQQIDEQRSKDLAMHHGIYYNPNFSRSWIHNQIITKLSNQNYLKKLVNQQLNQGSKKLLKKLLSQNSINKDNINLNNYYTLSDYGLIYEQNNSCYLFPQLKSLLKNILNTSQSQTNNSTVKKFKLKSTPTLKKGKCDLSFFHYLVLTLAYIKQHSTKKSFSTEQLASFMEKINLTNLSATDIVQNLLEYGYQQNLITSKLIVQPEIKSWLQTSHQEKVLSAINTFFPQSKSALRKIIAVLSHYPSNKKIPLDFAHQELQLEKIDHSQQQLLQLLNIIKIKNKQITLAQKSWQHFNQQVKFKYATPKTANQKIIVPANTKLKQLWQIAQKNQLLSIQENLIFKTK